MKIQCFRCGKPVSTEIPDSTVFRAVAECPECAEGHGNDEGRVRESVRWFAERMERKLKVNDHKTNWREFRATYLFHGLEAEMRKLGRFLLGTTPIATMEQVIDEAVDVANFAMMIADNARAALAEKGK